MRHESCALAVLGLARLHDANREVVQNKVPKIDAESLRPAKWPGKRHGEEDCSETDDWAQPTPPRSGAHPATEISTLPLLDQGCSIPSSR